VSADVLLRGARATVLAHDGPPGRCTWCPDGTGGRCPMLVWALAEIVIQGHAAVGWCTDCPPQGECSALLLARVRRAQAERVAEVRAGRMAYWAVTRSSDG
jgi:hypothetical protein